MGRTSAFVVVAVVAAVMPLQSAAVVWEFTGEVTSVYNNSTPYPTLTTVEVGDSVYGEFSFDESKAGGPGYVPEEWLYSGAIDWINVQAGEDLVELTLKHGFPGGDQNLIRVDDDADYSDECVPNGGPCGPPLTDRLQFWTQISGSNTMPYDREVEPTLNGVANPFLLVGTDFDHWDSDSATALSSTDLLAVPPPLTAFSSVGYYVTLSEANTGRNSSFHFEIHTLPEPSGIVMLASGVSALLVLRKVRARRS